MNNVKLYNRAKLNRSAPHIWDITDMIAQLRSHGDKCLFRYYENNELKTMSYSKFAEMVEQTAAGFAHYDLRGRRIAVIGDTSPQWLATYLGALAAGSVIIPMDKELAATEIKGFLQMVEADAIVYSPSFRDAFPAFIEEVGSLRYLFPIEFDGAGTETLIPFSYLLASGKKTIRDGYRIPLVHNHEEMCEMLFTSGTTGTSKCVMLCQKNIFSVVNAAMEAVCFVPEDVVLSVLPVHHTYELMCLLAEMCFGCEICINDSLRHVMKNIKLFRPTGLVLVPMIVSTMYKRIWAEAEKKGLAKKLKLGLTLSGALAHIGVDARKKLFSSVLDAFGGRLEKIICGGAKLNSDLIYSFDALGIAIYQGFGITECSPLTAVEPYYRRKPGSIGPAVSCCRMRIDANGELTDDGYSLGELQVRGDNVMLGYYQNPDANAQTFTEDGWFRTGDVGYMDEDGYFYITGRSKSVIVLENGKNVFPEEIEEYLSTIELISECVIVGRKVGAADSVCLTAIVYPDYAKFPEGTSEQTVCESIRTAINEINKKIPGYKRIKAIELRKTEFEKTTTRKIKRQLVK